MQDTAELCLEIVAANVELLDGLMQEEKKRSVRWGRELADTVRQNILS